MRKILGILLVNLGHLLCWRHFPLMIGATIIIAMSLFLRTDFYTKTLESPQTSQESESNESSRSSRSSKTSLLPPIQSPPKKAPRVALPRPVKSISGRVVGVSDGDTLTLLTPEKQQVKVRLNGIDAPESSQPYGKKAKQALSSLVLDKAILINITDRDQYGRIVADVYLRGRNHWINALLIKGGYAWVYRQYSKDEHLLKMEDEAKKQSRGLWRLPKSQRIPPWEYRKKRRNR